MIFVLTPKLPRVSTSFTDVCLSSSVTAKVVGLGSFCKKLMGGKLYISANIAGIIEDVGRSTSDPLTEIMAVLERGIPFEVTKDTEKETMDVYMTRETLLPFMALLPMLGEIMPEEFQNYAGFITDLGPIIQEGKTAELGLVLTQKKTAE